MSVEFKKDSRDKIPGWTTLGSSWDSFDSLFKKPFSRRWIFSLLGSWILAISPVWNLLAGPKEEKIKEDKRIAKLQAEVFKKNYPVFQRLILLSDIPRSLLNSNENNVIEYCMNNIVTIKVGEYAKYPYFLNYLSFADIIPGGILTLSVDGGLPWYRSLNENLLYTKGNFYKSLRALNWKSLSRKKRHKHQRWFEDFKLEDNNRVKFQNLTRIKCLERDDLSRMWEFVRVFIDESRIAKEKLKKMHKEADDFLSEQFEQDKLTRIISDTSFIDIQTLNIGIKELIVYLLKKFPNLIVSSGRRSFKNNDASWWAEDSMHMKWIAVDFVTNFTRGGVKERNYLHNVEAFLLSHWFAGQIDTLCHWSHYHLHINLRDWAFDEKALEKYKKYWDPKIVWWVIKYKPKKVWGVDLRFSLSQSDYQVFQRESKDGTEEPDIEIAVNCFKDRRNARKQLSKVWSIKQFFQEALWFI